MTSSGHLRLSVWLVMAFLCQACRPNRGGPDDFLQVYDLSTGTKSFSLAGRQGPTLDFAVSADGDLVLTAKALCSLPELRLIKDIDLHQAWPGARPDRYLGAVHSLLFLGRSRLALVGLEYGGFGLLDLDNSNVVRTFKPPIFQPSSVAVSADGTTIIASDALQPMAVSWTVADGEPRDIYAEQWLGSSGYVTLARNGTHRAWWHSQTGEAQDLAASARPEIEPRPGGQAQLSPDGRILLTYYGGVEGLNNIHSYRLWDIESGRLLSRRSGITLPIGHGGRYYSRCQSLAFSPDSRLLAVGRRDGRIEVREIDGGRLVREWKVPVGSCDLVTFHPDGKRLVTWGDSMIRLWEIASGANVRTFEVPILHGMATTPDGRWLVVGSGRPRGL